MSRKRPRFRREDEESVENGVEEKEQEREEYDAFKFMKNKKQAAAVAGIFFVVGFMVSWMMAPSLTGMVVEKGVNMDQIAQEGVDFLNEFFTDGSGGVSLKSVEDDGSLIKVTTEYQGNEIPILMTRDGEYVIIEGIGAVNMAEVRETVSQQPEETPQETQESVVPKSDVPVADIFVMSYCPYGLQMQKAAIPVMELLGDKADINIKFVGYVMHGEKEMVQNNNEYCIQKDQPDVFVDYLKCFVQSDDHAACVTETGVDQAKLDSCLADLESTFDVTNVFESSTDQYPPYPVDAVDANNYGVRGSPTFILNGQTVSVNRSPEAVKEAICDAFNTPPEECSTALSTTAENPGIGAIGSGTASAAAAATCG
jgi:protein-disulfide isomerase